MNNKLIVNVLKTIVVNTVPMVLGSITKGAIENEIMAFKKKNGKYTRKIEKVLRVAVPAAVSTAVDVLINSAINGTNNAIQNGSVEKKDLRVILTDGHRVYDEYDNGVDDWAVLTDSEELYDAIVNACEGDYIPVGSRIEDLFM